MEKSGADNNLASVNYQNGKKQNIMVFDYDGTLTLENGPFLDSTVSALRVVHDRELALLGIASGRDIHFLERVNARASLVFSFLVAENGAVTRFSDSEKIVLLGRDWSGKARRTFSDAPFPIQFSEIIASSSRDNAGEIARFVKMKGFDCKLVPNKKSVMICPPDLDKGVGVSNAVGHYGSVSEILLTCFGDGENDLALFGPADVRVAVSNGVPPLKEIADVVTEQEGGLGVEEYLRKNIL